MRVIRTDTLQSAPARHVEPDKTLPVSVLLPVLNEELNLGAALHTVAWANEVVVIDSGSTDGTVAAARAAGADVVQFNYSGRGPKKKAWALASLDLRNEWVFLLDADERVTDALLAQITDAIEAGEANGYYVDRELIFMGRSMRSFRPNWNLRLFRRGCAHVEDLGLQELQGTGDNEIHEHIAIDGEADYLSAPLLHNDYRGLSSWLDRHNKYATWEAHLYRKLRAEPIAVGPVNIFRIGAFERKRVLRRVWVRLPCRPVLRFFVWYFLRRGFLDGRAGFHFCVLMSYYEFIIGSKLYELEHLANG